MTNHTFAILAYKQSSFLEDCIVSLKSQTVPSKIVLCTSTPSDFLSQMATKHSIPLLINPNRQGIAEDWNFALKQCDTKYFTLAHQDDIYASSYTQTLLAALESREDALIAYCDYNEIVHRADEISLRSTSPNFTIKKWLNLIAFRHRKYIASNKMLLLMFGNPIGCPAVTYCLDNMGPFEFDANFDIDLDWDAWQRLAAKKGSFLWVRQPLVSHRIHTESETSMGMQDNRRKNEDKLIFLRMWPRPIAVVLWTLYTLSYKNNN